MYTNILTIILVTLVLTGCSKEDAPTADSDETVDELTLKGALVTFSCSSCLLTSRTWAAKERYNGVSGALRDTSPRVNSNNGRVVCVIGVG